MDIIKEYKTPTEWFDCARDLLQSFLILYTTNHIFYLEKRTAYPSTFIFIVGSLNLLGGLSIEVLFKSCIIIIDSNKIKDFYHHDLKKMYEFINENWQINLATNYYDYLDNLSEYIQWKSKYTTPRKDSKLKNEPQEFGDDIYNIIKIIWDKTFEKLVTKDTSFNVELKNSRQNSQTIKTTYFESEQENICKLITLKQ